MDSVGDQSSSRKEKAIGHIVTKFVEVYNRNDGDPIGINEAARRLGADKRRIYDIVKLFECIGLVEKISGKSQYVWKGFGASLYRVLSQLKDEGMKEKSKNVWHVTEETGNYEEENSTSPQPGTSLINNKKWKIARNIVKLFLCSDDGDIITIKDLTKALLTDEFEDGTIKMKSKVRLLYDPINVFSSINLIEKINTIAFRWIGPKPMADSASSKKRASGIGTSSLNRSANENSEVIDAEPISTIYPPYFYNPEDRWIMIKQSSQMDLARFADAFRSSQKDFGRK